MTQIATVERILDQNHAEISVPRKSACGHDCEECAGCGVTGTAVKARAVNPIGAQPGQKVVVESSTQKIARHCGIGLCHPCGIVFGRLCGGLCAGRRRWNSVHCGGGGILVWNFLRDSL